MDSDAEDEQQDKAAAASKRLESGAAADAVRPGDGPKGVQRAAEGAAADAKDGGARTLAAAKTQKLMSISKKASDGSEQQHHTDAAATGTAAGGGGGGGAHVDHLDSAVSSELEHQGAGGRKGRGKQQVRGGSGLVDGAQGWLACLKCMGAARVGSRCAPCPLVGDLSRAITWNHVHVVVGAPPAACRPSSHMAAARPPPPPRCRRPAFAA